jgi:hypothetical protein
MEAVSARLPLPLSGEQAAAEGDTLEQLTQKLSEAGIKYSFLPGLGDVDYVDDLRYLLEYLSARGDENLPAQQNLHDWLKTTCRFELPRIKNQVSHLSLNSVGV